MVLKDNARPSPSVGEQLHSAPLVNLFDLANTNFQSSDSRLEHWLVRTFLSTIFSYLYCRIKKR